MTQRSYILAATTDIEAHNLDEFRAWHDTEHLPERVGLKGFLRGRRYVNTGTGPKFLILYDIINTEIFSGEAYLARLNNPTPWSRRCLTFFRNTNRSLFEISDSLGVIDISAVALSSFKNILGKTRSADFADLAKNYDWAQVLSPQINLSETRSVEKDIFGNATFSEDILLCGAANGSDQNLVNGAYQFTLEKALSQDSVKTDIRLQIH